MSGVKDTLGTAVAEGGVWITLRADLPGGVSLGGDRSIEPGETKRLPAAVAFDLVHSGRAQRAEAPKAAREEQQPPAIDPDDPTTQRAVVQAVRNAERRGRSVATNPPKR